MLAVATAEGTYYRYAKLHAAARQVMPAIQVVEPTLEGYSGHCHALVSSFVRAAAALPRSTCGAARDRQA